MSHSHIASPRRAGRGTAHPASRSAEARDPDAAARAALEAGQAALTQGKSRNAARWLSVGRGLIALARDIETRATAKARAAANAWPSADFIEFEQACEADALAIVRAREDGRKEPVPRYEQAYEDADWLMRWRAAERAGLIDQARFDSGEVDPDELDLDAWLPEAFRRGSEEAESPTPSPPQAPPGRASGSD